MSARAQEIASTILSQMGGMGRIKAMTGAKNFVAHEDGVSFRIGRNSNGVNYVKVTLTPADLYDVEYGAIRGHNYKVKAKSEGLYNDMLKRDFERNTGMYLTL